MKRQNRSNYILTVSCTLILCCALLLSAVPEVQATNYPLSTGDSVISNALFFLRNAQNTTGSLGNHEETCYAIVAIEAAGGNPHDYVKSGTSLVDYISQEASSHLNTSSALPYEYYLLAIAAAGENPRSFGGVDVFNRLESMFTAGQIGKANLVNDDFWGIISLVGAGQPINSTIIQQSKNFILTNQNTDGGWGCNAGNSISDVCDTANAIMALIAAGESPSSSAIQNALSYIKSWQNDDGGFPYMEGDSTSDVASDARVIAAIRACGQDPTSSSWTVNGNNPVTHALSLQRTDGGFDWKENNSANSAWMTSYILPPLVGKKWPTRILNYVPPGDSSIPVISDLIPGSGTTVMTGNPNISASFSDDDSGIDVDSVIIKLDGSDITSSAIVSTSGFSYTPTMNLNEGTRNIQVTVHDLEGNKAYKEWNFTIDMEYSTSSDNTPPSISNLKPGNNTSISNSRPEIGASYSDYVSGIDTSSLSVKLDSVEVNVNSGTTGFNFTPSSTLSNGEHTVVLKISDQVGNQAIKTWSFKVAVETTAGTSIEVNSNGIVTKAVEIASVNNKASLQIPQGIRAVDRQGQPLQQVTIEPTAEKNNNPDGCSFIGLVYNFGPDGAAFDSPVELTLHYDESDISGIKVWDVNCDGNVNFTDVSLITLDTWPDTDDNAFCIAFFDENDSEWKSIAGSKADTSKNTVTAEIGHFSKYTIISNSSAFSAYDNSNSSNAISTGNISGSSSGALLVKNISVSPETVQAGGKVNIKVMAVNKDTKQNTYSISLMINNASEETREVTLAAGEEQQVKFVVSREDAGDYLVEINGQLSEFSVKEKTDIDWSLWAFIVGIIAIILAATAIIFMIRGKRRQV